MKKWFLLWILIGFTVSALKILAPIHEYSHLLGYQIDGVRAAIKDWTTINMYGTSYLGLLSGYLGELLFYSFTGITFALICKLNISGFCLGASIEAFVSAPISGDFKKILFSYGYIKYETLISSWYAYGGFLLTSFVVLYIGMIVKTLHPPLSNTLDTHTDN